MKLTVFRSTTFRLTLFLTSVFLLFTGSFFYKNVYRKQRTEYLQAEFDRFLDELFYDELNANPISRHFLVKNKDSYSLPATRPFLEPYTEDSVAQHLQQTESRKAKLCEFPYDKLSTDQQLCYDCLLFLYDNDIALSRYSDLSNPLSPQSGVQQQLPFLLSEYRFDSLEDTENYLCLLDSVYAYIESLCTIIRTRSAGNVIPAVALQNSALQCLEFINTPPEENILLVSFSERLSGLEHLDEIETAVYEMKNRYRIETEILPAYRLLYETLTALTTEANRTETLSAQDSGLAAHKSGKEYYSLLAQQAASTDLTVPQMKALLEQYYNSALAHMKSLAKQNPDLAGHALNDCFPDGTSVYSAVSSGDSVDILRFLQQNTASLLPALNSTENLRVTLKTISPCLQKMSAPALYLLSPLDSYLEHTVYLNPAYSGSTGYTTISHETFPGHLSARVSFLSGNPHPIRTLTDFIGWDEGWASLAELYSLSFLTNPAPVAAAHTGASDISSEPQSRTLSPENATIEFLCAYEIASLCLYGLSDIGVHYDGWTREDTVAFWCEHGLDDESAGMLWELIVSEPAYYLPYSMGLVQMLELRKTAVSALNDAYSETDFCSALLSLGPMPYPVCEKYLLQHLPD